MDWLLKLRLALQGEKRCAQTGKDHWSYKMAIGYSISCTSIMSLGVWSCPHKWIEVDAKMCHVRFWTVLNHLPCLTVSDPLTDHVWPTDHFYDNTITKPHKSLWVPSSEPDLRPTCFGGLNENPDLKCPEAQFHLKKCWPRLLGSQILCGSDLAYVGIVGGPHIMCMESPRS